MMKFFLIAMWHPPFRHRKTHLFQTKWSNKRAAVYLLYAIAC